MMIVAMMRRTLEIHDASGDTCRDKRWQRESDEGTEGINRLKVDRVK